MFAERQSDNTSLDRNYFNGVFKCIHVIVQTLSVPAQLIKSHQIKQSLKQQHSFTQASQDCHGRTLFMRHTLYQKPKHKNTLIPPLCGSWCFPVITATLHLYARPSLSTGHIKKAHRPPTRCQPAALTGYLLCNMTTSQTTLRNISRARVHLTSAHNDLQDKPKGHKHDLFTLMYFAHGVLRNTLLEIRSFSVHSMVTGSHICHV